MKDKMTIVPYCYLPACRVDLWNYWRREHPHAKINLHGVSLSWLNLTGIDLHTADMRECNLESTILRGADLSAAWLLDANICHTKFEDANLNGVCLDFYSPPIAWQHPWVFKWVILPIKRLKIKFTKEVKIGPPLMYRFVKERKL